MNITEKLKQRPGRGKSIRLYVPPMMIIGVTIILLIVVVVLAARNLNREKLYTSQVLMEKGAVLIKSFEAGARTGMMSMNWGERLVQRFLVAVARQPDVLYLTITDENGKILAASDPSLIGGQYMEKTAVAALKPSNTEKWRITGNNGIRAFEVYRYFRPYSNSSTRPMAMGCGGSWCSPASYNIKNQLIFAGFDMSSFEDARREDIRNTIIVSSVLLILGFAGFLSLFLAQGYSATKRRLQDTSAVADEVVTNMPVGLIVTGRDGRVMLLNSAAESIIGIGFEAARGRHFARIMPLELAGALDLLKVGKRIMDKEINCVVAGGDTIPLSVTAARVINNEGVFVGNILMIHDLSEIMRLREDIHKKEKFSAIGKLASGIAHEIRNPLSSIKGLATYFRNKFPKGSEDHEAADIMVREVDRLNRVIGELLEFSRPPEINLKPTDINRALDHSVCLIRPDAESKRIRVELIKEDNLPAIAMDPDRFLQCLLNLYLNGIQAMEKGGRLTVRSFDLDDKLIGLEVKDSGPGIPPENMNKIFDPYFTSKPAGTGLGLAIVYKIIDAHKGKIEVSSKKGKGAVFTIYLPKK